MFKSYPVPVKLPTMSTADQKVDLIPAYALPEQFLVPNEKD